MGNLQPMKMNLYMADGSCVQPTCIIKDVSVQVGKFFVPNDFVVMDIEADALVPVILGRPFLATDGARIDVREGLLNLTIGDEKMEFQFNKIMNGSSMDEVVTSVLKAEEGPMHKPAEVKVTQVPEDEKKKEEFPSGFLPRPNDNKVYAIGEDDYAFCDLLFGEGRKKEGEGEMAVSQSPYGRLQRN